MSTSEVYQEAAILLRQHGLAQKGWSFELSNQKRRVGECNHARMVIRFSIHFLEKTPARDITDTLLHEIAHAIVGPNHGHDNVWKRKAIELGAIPRACTTEAVTTAKPNFVIKCGNCDNTVATRYRLKRTRSWASARSNCCLAELKFYRITRS
jgi:predicted SprT family Zn-dependent metalloprotease